MYYGNRINNSIAIQDQIRSNVIRFFRDKNALSPETAIELEEIDFAEMGLGTFFSIVNINKQKNALGFYGIRIEGENRFWFDFELSKASQKQSQKAVMLIMAIVLLISLYIIFLL